MCNPHSSMVLLSQHPLYTLFKGPEGGMVEMECQDEMAEMESQDEMEPKEDKDRVEELVPQDHVVCKVIVTIVCRPLAGYSLCFSHMWEDLGTRIEVK